MRLSNLTDARIAEREPQARCRALEEDYEHLGRQLARRGVDIEALTERAMAFRVARAVVGRRHRRHALRALPGPGEPRDVFEKLEDCAAVHAARARHAGGLAAHPVGPARAPGRAARRSRERARPVLRLHELEHVPGPAGAAALVQVRQPEPHRPGGARARRSSTTSSASRSARKLGAARAHGVDRRRRQLPGPGALAPGARSLPRQPARDLRGAARRLAPVHRAQAVRAGVLLDGASTTGAPATICARELGDRAFSLVDLGHHAPNVNIEHDRGAADPVRQAGGLPLQRQQVRRRRPGRGIDQAVPAVPRSSTSWSTRELERSAGFDPAYMLDQSHNVTDPIESLMTSAIELVRAYVQAHLVDREALARAPGAQRRADGAADLEAGVHHRRLADPGDGAQPRGRRDRPGGRVPRVGISGSQGERTPRAVTGRPHAPCEARN